MWDELAPDALHGAVVAVHNIIFGYVTAHLLTSTHALTHIRMHARTHPALLIITTCFVIGGSSTPSNFLLSIPFYPILYRPVPSCPHHSTIFTVALLHTPTYPRPRTHRQLATMSFNMREIGIPEQEVESRVVEMSRECELSEDQELQLIQTIRGYRNRDT